MLIARLDFWVVTVGCCLKEKEERGAYRQKEHQLIHEIAVASKKAINWDCQENYKAFDLGTGHSSRRRAGQRGTEEGGDEDVADGD